MLIDWAGISAVIITPIIRSVTGWLQNALDDGIISDYEWQELASTVLRVGLTTMLIYFGIGSIPGLDVPALSAAAAAFLFDLLYTKLKKE